MEGHPEVINEDSAITTIMDIAKKMEKCGDMVEKM